MSRQGDLYNYAMNINECLYIDAIPKKGNRNASKEEMRELLEQTRLFLWRMHNELLCEEDYKCYNKFSVPKSEL